MNLVSIISRKNARDVLTNLRNVKTGHVLDIAATSHFLCFSTVENRVGLVGSGRVSMLTLLINKCSLN